MVFGGRAVIGDGSPKICRDCVTGHISPSTVFIRVTESSCLKNITILIIRFHCKLLSALKLLAYQQIMVLF